MSEDKAKMEVEMRRTNLVSIFLQTVHGLAVEVLNVGRRLQIFEERIESLLIFHKERGVVLEPTSKVGFHIFMLSERKLDLDDALERFETPKSILYIVSSRNIGYIKTNWCGKKEENEE